MKNTVLVAPVVLGGLLVASRFLTRDQRARLSRLPGALMTRCLEHMPDDFPPKAMTFGVRRIQAQNDEILALLREQNTLLRRRPASRRTPDVTRESPPPSRPRRSGR